MLRKRIIGPNDGPTENDTVEFHAAVQQTADDVGAEAVREDHERTGLLSVPLYFDVSANSRDDAVLCPVERREKRQDGEVSIVCRQRNNLFFLEHLPDCGKPGRPRTDSVKKEDIGVVKLQLLLASCLRGSAPVCAVSDDVDSGAIFDSVRQMSAGKRQGIHAEISRKDAAQISVLRVVRNAHEQFLPRLTVARERLTQRLCFCVENENNDYVEISVRRNRSSIVASALLDDCLAFASALSDCLNGHTDFTSFRRCSVPV